jgi:predicted nucleic acid-binding protein
VAFLVDTSLLVRLANRTDASYPVADQAVIKLRLRGEMLYLTPQNLIEFRAVATRPLAINGLGFSPTATEAEAAGFERVFPLLEETRDIYPAWKALVAAAGVIGKQVHDARLVAVCHVHRVSHLLTFNVPHFAALAGIAPGVVVVHPANV